MQYRIVALLPALLLSVLMLAGCATAPSAVVKPSIPKDQATCLAAGGEWRRLGIPCDTCPKSCDLPTSDAGAACSDFSHCQGACLADSEEATSGRCAARMMSFGCHYFMEHGSTRYLCAD